MTGRNRFPAMRLVPARTGPHWLLGDPADDAADAKRIAQLAANGIDCYNEPLRWDPAAQDWAHAADDEVDDLLDGADGWRVLLRVRAEPQIRMYWGRSPDGVLYYLIRADDLVAGRFTDAWSLLVDP